MNLQDLKKAKEQRVSNLIDECSMFFAFSDEQFIANKTPLPDGEKYVALGAGAYMPKSKVQIYIDGMEKIELWYKQNLKVNALRKKEIAYQLNNYECYYTGDITDALNALGSDYTKEEVLKVYRANFKKYAESL